MKKEIKQLYIRKGVIALILGCLLYFAMVFPVHAAEDSGTCGEQLTWILSGGQLTISGSGDMTDYKDENLPPWYRYASEIRSVSLPSELTSIGDLAFYQCENLSSVLIPSKTKDIGEYAFAECKNLLQISFGKSLERIGEGAFYDCERLTSVYFPNTLQNIGTKSFYRCYGLQTVTIPASVTYLGTSVFAYNTGLIRVVMNASVERIPDWTFYGCINLADVVTGSSIVSAGNYSFWNCENLQGIYTKSDDINQSYELDKSLSSESSGAQNSFVADYQIPDRSVSVTDDGEKHTEKTAIQTEDTVIVVEQVTDHTRPDSKKETIVQGTLQNNSSWVDLSEAVDDILKQEDTSKVKVNIQLADNEVDGAYLSLLAGKNVDLQLTTSNGVVWKSDMSGMTKKDFSGAYNFDAVVTRIDAAMTDIKSDYVYKVKFSGYTDFNAIVGIKVGNYYDTASLYQKNYSKYEMLGTVIVDQNDLAWYLLAGISKDTEYYIGLNVEDYNNVEKAVIPETMYNQFGINENSGLTDSDGTQYTITGRTSKWGISGGRFAVYVAVAVFAVVLIVSIVMIYMNKMKLSKERYMNMAKEDKEREDRLRLDIMRELLGKKKTDSGEDE